MEQDFEMPPQCVFTVKGEHGQSIARVLSKSWLWYHLEAAPASARARLYCEGWPMNSPHVLVIEDEEKITDFLRRGLVYEGYRVDVAHDGQSGLALARENPPDLVILDWMLPGMDGLEV